VIDLRPGLDHPNGLTLTIEKVTFNAAKPVSMPSRLVLVLLALLILPMAFSVKAQSAALDYFNLSYSHTEQKQPDSAMYYLSFALKLDPSMVNGYYNRGVIRFQKNDLLGAIEDFDKCLNLEISHGQAYNNRGYIYIMLGEVQKGCKDLRIGRDLGIEQAKGNFSLYCKDFKE
jgi:tetratricopeptide (TPR) repeat protein